jgi:hypothetical protein
MFDPQYKRLTDFLVAAGIEAVPHTGKTYLGHLINVHRLMHEQGCDVDLCRAGMFHSIYGTEQFQGFKLSLDRRTELREMIGERAERLAYLNCAMDRSSMDAALEKDQEPYDVRDRLTGEVHRLDRAMFDDLCQVHLYDWLEQAPRSRLGWKYRRAAYRRMAERLGTQAVALHDRTFAEEKAAS